MPEAEAVLAQFRNVAGNAADSVRSVEVDVRNGTGRYNEATNVTDALDKVGFSTGTPSDELGVTGAASIIRYHAGQEAQARLLARHLDSEVTFELVDDSSSSDGSNGSSSTDGSTGTTAHRRHPAAARHGHLLRGGARLAQGRIGRAGTDVDHHDQHHDVDAARRRLVDHRNGADVHDEHRARLRARPGPGRQVLRLTHRLDGSGAP